MLRRLGAATLALAAAAALAACEGESSSGAPSEPSSPSSSAVESPAGTPSPSASSDTASQALCSALTNAVGAATRWQLDPPTPASREVAGVAVPSCEDAADAGTLLTVAYLPAAGSVGGPDLLTGLCKAVVGIKPAGAARSCSAPEQAKVKAGVEVRRADLAAGDAGVLVLSFTSNRTEYQDRAVADLGAVGEALAADQLLTRAIG